MALPPAGPPGETLHNVQTYDVCPGADNTDASTRFLNTFENFYNTLEDTNPSVRLVGMGSIAEYVQLSGGWQPGGPDQPNVVATLTLTGSWYPADANSNYTDQFEIDRVPDQG